jgi:hypothetical protein
MADVDRGTLIAGTLLALALGAWFAWQSRNGAEQSVDAAARADAFEAQTEGKTASDRPVALYKWQDDAGVWHYTDQAPADRDYEVIRDTPNVTSVPTVVPEVPNSTRSDENPGIPPPPE